MAQLRVPRPIGRPRTTPNLVLADKAYSSRAIRTHLRRRGIRAVIPQPSDQVTKRKKRGRSGGRPPAFDLLLDRSRILAEKTAAGQAAVVGLCYRLADGSAQLVASRGLDAAVPAAS